MLVQVFLIYMYEIGGGSMKKIVSIALTLVLCFTLSGCGEQANNEKKEYTIEFISDGKYIAKIKVMEGELINPPENPIKADYTFSHWATHEHSTDGSEKFDFTTAPTKNNTLFAHFTYTPKENGSQNSNTTYGYEKIYNEYSEKLKKQCPTLSIKECAEIATEGTTKMAEYMYSAKGTDGQYATYQMWVEKLTNVYLSEAR